MSKRSQIIEMSKQGIAPKDIADEIYGDSSETSYIYKIRSECKEEWCGSEGNELRGSNSGASEQPPASEPTDPPADHGGGKGRVDPLPDEPEDQTSSLELDDPAPKEYDCGNCEASVEYLDKNCSECGERLLWSKIE